MTNEFLQACANLGIIINELLLMTQGVSALSYIALPYINELLLAAAMILFIGTITISLGNLVKPVE